MAHTAVKKRFGIQVGMVFSHCATQQNGQERLYSLVSYSLNSFMGGLYRGLYDSKGGIRRCTRSFDNSPHEKTEILQS